MTALGVLIVLVIAGWLVWHGPAVVDAVRDIWGDR